MTHKSDIVYGYVQGAGLLADIASPQGHGPHPVVLSVHGGRWIRGTRHDNAAIDVEQWAGFGFFAMTIEYRLVTCSPAPACYQDMRCAIRWIHAHTTEYRLDTSRFFLIGQSAGGHMVSLAAALGEGKFEKTGGWEDHPDDFTAAVSVSGAYDLTTLSWGSGWIPPNEAWDRAREYASPLTHVSAGTKPLLLVHSDDDGSVPIRQALKMVERLQAVNAPYEFLHYSDRGHIGMTPETIKAARTFMAKYQ